MKKFDVVIEAARYKDGRIVSVRAFERRGAAFSDRVIINRDELVKRIKDGEKCVTGRRIEFLAGSFETGPAVQVIAQNGSEILATSPSAKKDELQGVPVF